MSEDRRKNLRTQGKYSDGRAQKSRDKKQRSSLESKDLPPEPRLPPRRYSDGNKCEENTSSLTYEENSDYKFQQIEKIEKPVEIKQKGTYILSKTKNGESRVLYEPDFFTEDEGDNYFDILNSTIDFDARNIIIHGIEYPQPRLVAWFGPFAYKYSGVTLEAAEMPEVVKEIKNRIEKLLESKNIKASFNSVLINLYRNGKDSVSWHSDDELMLGITPTIASVSLGETRKFEMRPKTSKNYDGRSPPESSCKFLMHLIHGSLVIMTGCMQEDWQHRVPKEYHDRGPRINLTFRTVYPLDEAKRLRRKRLSFLRRNSTPRKKIRFDDCVSPSNVSSFSGDANESYDEGRAPNYSWSSKYDESYDEASAPNYSWSSNYDSRDLSFDEHDKETYVEGHKMKRLNDSIEKAEFCNTQKSSILHEVLNQSSDSSSLVENNKSISSHSMNNDDNVDVNVKDNRDTVVDVNDAQPSESDIDEVSIFKKR